MTWIISIINRFRWWIARRRNRIVDLPTFLVVWATEGELVPAAEWIEPIIAPYRIGQVEWDVFESPIFPDNHLVETRGEIEVFDRGEWADPAERFVARWAGGWLTWLAGPTVEDVFTRVDALGSREAV